MEVRPARSQPRQLGVSYSGAPLFTATRNGVAQPITGGFEISRAAGRGYNIVFGTGQYFASDDNAVSSSSPIQSIYSVWDNLVAPVGGGMIWSASRYPRRMTASAMSAPTRSAM
ncbi:PilC/PilY family type IV pilus protein [Stenotrophomonas rhizophila]